MNETKQPAVAGPVEPTVRPLPAPEVLHELHDAPCPACGTMLRALPPLKMGYTAAQMLAYAAQAAADERERCAKVCEQTDDDGEGPDCWDWHAKDYARAIRGA